MIQQFADWLIYDICGIDATTHLGEALNFFVYDTLKIIILLFVISIVILHANSQFFKLFDNRLEFLGNSCQLLLVLCNRYYNNLDRSQFGRQYQSIVIRVNQMRMYNHH